MMKTDFDEQEGIKDHNVTDYRYAILRQFKREDISRIFHDFRN